MSLCIALAWFRTCLNGRSDCPLVCPFDVVVSPVWLLESFCNGLQDSRGPRHCGIFLSDFLGFQVLACHFQSRLHCWYRVGFRISVQYPSPILLWVSLGGTIWLPKRVLLLVVCFLGLELVEPYKMRLSKLSPMIILVEPKSY